MSLKNNFSRIIRNVQILDIFREYKRNSESKIERQNDSNGRGKTDSSKEGQRFCWLDRKFTGMNPMRNLLEVMNEYLRKTKEKE